MKPYNTDNTGDGSGPATGYGPTLSADDPARVAATLRLRPQQLAMLARLAEGAATPDELIAAAGIKPGKCFDVQMSNLRAKLGRCALIATVLCNGRRVQRAQGRRLVAAYELVRVTRELAR